MTFSSVRIWSPKYYRASKIMTQAPHWVITIMPNNNAYYHLLFGTAVAQWLRCCAKNRKVAGAIPDDVIGIFHLYNPSNRTMFLGSTQPLTEMITRRISRV
jgi:hypothetical protein